MSENPSENNESPESKVRVIAHPPTDPKIVRYLENIHERIVKEFSRFTIGEEQWTGYIQFYPGFGGNITINFCRRKKQSKNFLSGLFGKFQILGLPLKMSDFAMPVGENHAERLRWLLHGFLVNENLTIEDDTAQRAKEFDHRMIDGFFEVAFHEGNGPLVEITPKVLYSIDFRIHIKDSDQLYYL